MIDVARLYQALENAAKQQLRLQEALLNQRAEIDALASVLLASHPELRFDFECVLAARLQSSKTELEDIRLKLLQAHPSSKIENSS